MNDQELLRYSRQILLNDLDVEGQERLLSSHIAIIGVGGLGSAASMYLAAAGVGILTLVDDDVVDLPNLQRQIIFGEEDLSAAKVVAAKQRLQAINTHCQVHTLQERPNDETVDALLRTVDIVLDCSDNFETRYRLNRACLRTETRLISGAAIQWGGQVAVFQGYQPDAPCYACLYPEQAEDQESSCTANGVVAPLVGIIGSMQALEAIKFICRINQTNTGTQLHVFDGLTTTWRQHSILKDPHCKDCSL